MPTIVPGYNEADRAEFNEVSSPVVPGKLIANLSNPYVDIIRQRILIDAEPTSLIQEFFMKLQRIPVDSVYKKNLMDNIAYALDRYIQEYGNNLDRVNVEHLLWYIIDEMNLWSIRVCDLVTQEREFSLESFAERDIPTGDQMYDQLQQIKGVYGVDMGKAA